MFLSLTHAHRQWHAFCFAGPRCTRIARITFPNTNRNFSGDCAQFYSPTPCKVSCVPPPSVNCQLLEPQSRNLLLNNYLPPQLTPPPSTFWRLLVLFDSSHEENYGSLLLTDGIFYRPNLQTNIFRRTLPNSTSCSLLIKIKHAASPLSHVY